MHTIRLRGPWRYEVLDRTAGDDAGPPDGKQQMPADWADALGSDFRGTVRYRRVFHEPTGLEDAQQVWLVIEGVTSAAAVVLNDTPLPTCDLATTDWRYDIRALLLPTSHLIIDVTHPAEAEGCGGLVGEVRLEIQTVRPRPVD